MIRHAIIGAGNMATQHFLRFSEQRGIRVVAVCDADAQRAEAFAQRHQIARWATQIEDLLTDGSIDSVSVVTPDASHAAISLAAIAQGKHVLCEKPLAVNYRDAAKMRDAAQKAGVINMVNFSYRDSSAIQKATKLVAAGKLGTIRHVHASYLQSWLAQDEWGNWPTSPQWLWRLSSAHGSKGVLGDIGVHILDFASMPVGDMAAVHCKLKTFEKAENDRIGEFTLDANDSAIITTEFGNGAIGTIHTTRWAFPHRNSLKLQIYGDKASIEIDLDKSYTKLLMSKNRRRTAGPWEEIDCGKTPSIYQRFARSIRSGKNDQPDFARGAQIQKALDACQLSDAKDKTVRLD